MILHSHTIELRLLDDCVLSESGATEGAHESLSRISGSALLGAAAAQLYQSLTPGEAFMVFHSGKLRFGDGLPASPHGAPTWPVPMCWHYAKNQPPKGERLHSEKIYNFLQLDRIEKAQGVGGEEAQAKPMRDGYVSLAGDWVKPQHTYRMKTAIDANSLRATDAQLFGYSALQRGQTFMARIEADEDVDVGLFKRVTCLFNGQLLLGHSRSAEYGRVSVKPHVSAHSIQHGELTEDKLTLWLLSDLAPCDMYGNPTLVFDPQALGFPAGVRVQWGKTFTRTRRYSPWNAKRHGHDTERMVLSAGGIICLHMPSNSDYAEFLGKVQRGLGLHREAGLGQVWVNPPLLNTDHPAFVMQDHRIPTRETHHHSVPDHPLVGWLRGSSTQQSSTKVEDNVKSIAERYRLNIDNARRAKGYPDSAHEFYPSRSQWGTVLELARSKDATDLYAVLFVGSSAAIKPSSKGWDLELPPSRLGGAWLKLGDWLKSEIASENSCDAQLVQQLARRLMDHSSARRA